LAGLLGEQISYDRAAAAEYFGLALPDVDASGAEVVAALRAFRPAGAVLEFACGPGTWTVELLREASSVTAVDAAPEMLAVAASRVHDARVRFVQCDIFDWMSDRRYDVVFFAFWLSHVPIERFAAFWALVRESLAADGRVFFVDDGYRTPDELIEGEDSSTIRRRLSDGGEYRIVKMPHRPSDLHTRLDELGWSIELTQTSGPFFWGCGTPR
jgi:demethylmenaquinone methyltransferase/2-methoxy-6-polyprenyl-1,4-benzoquinol methylase